MEEYGEKQSSMKALPLPWLDEQGHLKALTIDMWAQEWIFKKWPNSSQIGNVICLNSHKFWISENICWCKLYKWLVSQPSSMPKYMQYT